MGNFTTPIAGNSSARLLEAQIKINPQNFIDIPLHRVLASSRPAIRKNIHVANRQRIMLQGSHAGVPVP